MTKFEMKKNELLEKGKQEGYLLVSEVVEIAKECKASKAEVMAFRKEIEQEKIDLLEKAPAKKKNISIKVHEIKSFDERKSELIKKGKEKGHVTYEELASALKGLEVDNDSLDDLYNALMENDIAIIGEEDEASSKNGAKIEEEPIILNDAEITKDININDPVRMYLKEIGRISLLTPEEELELSKRVANGEEEAKNKLAESNLRLVVSIAIR